MPLTLFYCGADKSWRELQTTGFTRRNTCLLRAFSRSDRVERIIVVNYVLRSRIINAVVHGLRSRKHTNDKVIDVFVTSMLPERWSWLPARALNKWMTRLQIWMQAGALPRNNLVTWCYWPEGFRVAQRLKLPGKWVFDADHNILHDKNRSAGPSDTIETLLQEVAQKVDLVVAASRSILEWFKSQGVRHFTRLRNGVDTARFERRSPRQSTNHSPRIGYVGVLSPWIDWQLLQQIAILRPGWQFVVAGAPYRKEVRGELNSLPNVEFIGKLQPNELSTFLASLDIGLGLYQRGSGSDVDSMKLFDYLAAGLPVVTTPFHDELEIDYDGLLEFGQNAEEYVKAIEIILQRDQESSSAWNVRCRKFVERNTWAARADEIVNLLLTLVSPSTSVCENVS